MKAANRGAYAVVCVKQRLCDKPTANRTESLYLFYIVFPYIRLLVQPHHRAGKNTNNGV